MEVTTPVNVVRTPKHHDGGVSVGLPDSSYRAFEILYFACTALPALAGLGKVFGLFAHWARFLPAAVGEVLGAGLPDYVRAAGLCELALAVLIAAKPRAGGLTLAAWLWLGVLDMLAIPGHYAIAGCLAGLSAGAIALSYLAEEFDKKP